MASQGEPESELHQELMVIRQEDLGGPAPESDGVNLQCISSSDFVVGQQTTFNGPVTIINCTEELYKPAKEEVVIREKIITPAAVTEINALAEKKPPDDKFIVEDKKEKKETGLFFRVNKTKFLKVPIFGWIFLFIVVFAGCLVFFLGKDGSLLPSLTNEKTLKIPYNGKEYNFFTREDWDARPALKKVEQKVPVPYVIISHSATDFCYMKPTCMELIRNIQGDQLNRSPAFADIAYNFMIGGDGNIYEGRGWKTRNVHSGFVNGKNVDILFIGSFENFDPPTYPQTEAAKALIEYGVNNTYIAEDYKLIAANASYATLSPGIQVYKEIMTWPHFDPNPQEHIDE